MSPEPSRSGARQRILIVDDDAAQRSLLTSFLTSQGFDTLPVDSGERALEVLRTQEFSMMISDVRMPGISGLETLRRAHQEHAVLPVLLVTAYTDFRDAVGAMRDGAVNTSANPSTSMNCSRRYDTPWGFRGPPPCALPRTSNCPDISWLAAR